MKYKAAEFITTAVLKNVLMRSRKVLKIGGEGGMERWGRGWGWSQFGLWRCMGMH